MVAPPARGFTAIAGDPARPARLTARSWLAQKGRIVHTFMFSLPSARACCRCCHVADTWRDLPRFSLYVQPSTWIKADLMPVLGTQEDGCLELVSLQDNHVNDQLLQTCSRRVLTRMQGAA